MTTKILTGAYANGYAVAAPITTLSIAPTGYVGGTGVTSGTVGAYSVINDGTVVAKGAYTYDGVDLGDGGLVTNGTSGDTHALLSGQNRGVVVQRLPGTVDNIGTILSAGTATGSFRQGVYLQDGGAITNGAADDSTAFIAGYVGVDLGDVAVVTNYGTIAGSGAAGSTGVLVSNGRGTIVNGAASSTTALIEGAIGLQLDGSGDTLLNFGTILSTGGEEGVYVGEVYGTIVNGSAADKRALIKGTSGITLEGAADYSTVVNYGTLEALGGGYSNAGVYAVVNALHVTNGSATDTTAEVLGAEGVVTTTSATVTNFGSIIGGAHYSGVRLKKGGAVTNGSVHDTTASIHGYLGISAAIDQTTVANFGTISGIEAGISLSSGGSVTNGSATDHAALVQGSNGVRATTLINFGEIDATGKGADAYAVGLGGPGALLIIEPGSTIIGAIASGGGELEMADKTQLSSTSFDGFGTIDIGAGAGFTVTRGGTLASDFVSQIEGAGTLTLDGGAVTIGIGTGVSVAKINVEGLTKVEFETYFTFAKTWDQTGGTTSATSAADTVKFAGAGDSFTGALTGKGTIDLTGAGDTLKSLTISIAKTEIDAASVNISGSILLTGEMTATCPDVLLTSNVVLSGGGSLVLSNTAANEIVGSSATTELENLGDTIEGAGDLGGGTMTLLNKTGGVIDGDGTVALTLNTGTTTIVNGGVIEATGTGGVIVTSAIDSTGTLAAMGGDLTVEGAVTGGGAVTIDGATTAFAAAFSQAVDFAGGGELKLAQSVGYTGKVTGFSKAGTDTLDLEDIAFGGGTTATFSGSAASGVLTVTDGTHTAKITLVGNYLASTFTVASDGGGGTLVTDPPKAAAMASAMAAFAPTSGQSVSPSTAPAAGSPALASPHG